MYCSPLPVRDLGQPAHPVSSTTVISLQVEKVPSARERFPYRVFRYFEPALGSFHTHKRCMRSDGIPGPCRCRCRNQQRTELTSWSKWYRQSSGWSSWGKMSGFAKIHDNEQLYCGEVLVRLQHCAFSLQKRTNRILPWADTPLALESIKIASAYQRDPVAESQWITMANRLLCGIRPWRSVEVAWKPPQGATRKPLQPPYDRPKPERTTSRSPQHHTESPMSC